MGGCTDDADNNDHGTSGLASDNNTRVGLSLAMKQAAGGGEGRSIGGVEGVKPFFSLWW